jgi:hypothetical protein
MADKPLISADSHFVEPPENQPALQGSETTLRAPDTALPFV